MITDEMVYAAMSAFEPHSSVLRYREAGGWHVNDMIAMRAALTAVATRIHNAALEDAADIVENAWVDRSAFEACEFAEQAILDLKE